jgi:hypothetical protein
MSWLNSDESSEEDEYGFSDFDNDESVEALEPVQLPDNSAKESVANWGAGVLPETEPEAIKGGSFLPTLSLSKDEAGNNTEGSNEKSTAPPQKPLPNIGKSPSYSDDYSEDEESFGDSDFEDAFDDSFFNDNQTNRSNKDKQNGATKEIERARQEEQAQKDEEERDRQRRKNEEERRETARLETERRANKEAEGKRIAKEERIRAEKMAAEKRAREEAEKTRLDAERRAAENARREAEENARREAEENARQAAKERACQEAEEKAKLQAIEDAQRAEEEERARIEEAKRKEIEEKRSLEEEEEKKRREQILQQEEERQKINAEEQARRERKILEAENDSEESFNANAKVEISKAIIQPVFSEEEEQRLDSPSRAEDRKSQYRRDDTENNEEERNLLRQKYHGRDPPIGAQSFMSLREENNERIRNAGKRTSKYKSITGRIQGKQSKRKRKKKQKRAPHKNPVEKSESRDGDARDQPFHKDVHAEKMGAYFSFRAKHKVHSKPTPGTARGKNTKSSRRSKVNYEKYSYREMGKKYKKKRSKRNVRPGEKSPKLLALEAKVRESQRKFDSMSSSIAKKTQSKERETPEKPKYSPLLPEEIINTTLTDGGILGYESKKGADLYAKHWGQHAPVTFGTSIKRVVETRTLSTQTPSILPGLVNVLGQKQEGSSPKTVGELLRYAAPTISFPKLQTLSRSPAKRMIAVKKTERHETYKPFASKTSTSTSKGLNRPSRQQKKSKQYKLCESVLMDLRRFIEQDRPGAQRIFTHAEKNGDGSVSLYELEDALKHIGMKTSRRKLNWIIKAFRRREQDNFINYWDIMRGVRTTLRDPVMLARMIENAIAGKGRREYLLNTALFETPTKDRHAPTSLPESPEIIGVPPKASNVTRERDFDASWWTVDIREESYRASRNQGVVQKGQINIPGLTALKKAFFTMSQSFFISCLSKRKKPQWERSYKTGDVKIMYMGTKDQHELLVDAFETILEPALKMYKHELAGAARIKDIPGIMEVLNSTLLDPSVQRLACDRLDAVIEFTFKASPKVVPVVVDTRPEPEAKTTLQSPTNSENMRKHRRSKRMTYLLRDNSNNLEHSKFHAMTSKERHDLYNSTDKFLESAAEEAQKKKVQRLREKQRLAQIAKMKARKDQEEKARKEKNIAVERERLKKLNADRKAREEEASLTKKDQGLPRKSLLMRYETKGNADVAEETDGEDAYDDDEDFYSEDEFENEEVANDPMEESVSSKADFSEEIKRLQNAERTVSRQTNRIDELEESLTRIAASQEPAKAKLEERKEQKSTFSKPKPSFGRKKKEKRKYY